MPEVVGLPTDALVEQALAGNDNVANTLRHNSTADNLVYIDASYGAVEAATTVFDYSTSRMVFEIDTAMFDMTQNLVLGFLDAELLGNDFGQINFSVRVNHQDLLNTQFIDSHTALDFFDDKVVDLGSWSQFTSFGDSIVMEVFFEMADVGTGMSGFSFNALIGNSFVNATTVPVPAGIWLLMSAIVISVRFTRR